MSCEKNRGAFVSHVGGGGSPAATAFGGEAEAGAALETIFDTARAQAAPRNTPQQTIAEAKTRLLFDWMRRDGFKPPTHSKTGLPKADAQFGYAAMYDTLTALRDGKPMPALAVDIAATLGGQRALQAVRADEALARMRCASCGRFAPSPRSGKPPHVCPNTATPESFQRALTRRLGVGISAYPADTLASLLDQARGDGVAMRHPITGELVQASLDSLPLALTQGFVPDAWQGQDGLALVEVSNGRIAPVLDATGLTTVTPSSGAVAAAALASGAAIPAGTPLVSPTGVALVAHAVSPPAVGGTPTVSGGSAYDVRRFVGTEFRKGKGDLVIADGTTYTVGERSHDPRDWAHARTTGFAPPPPPTGAFSGIAVGRTLVAAAEMLRTGSFVTRADGVIEVFDAAGGMVALYDPATRTAGDVAGTPNASAAQMAAVIAYRSEQTSQIFDTALHESLYDASIGTTTPLSVSDGAYLAIKHDIEHTGPLTLGGVVSAAQCPECGRFMGAGGCRAYHAPAASATWGVVGPPDEFGAAAAAAFGVTAPRGSGVAVPAGLGAVPPITVNVESPTVNVDAPQVTVESPTVQVESPTVNVDAPQVTVHLDPSAVAERVAARMPAPVAAARTAVDADGTPVEAVLLDAAVLDRMLERLDRMQQPAAATPSTPTAPAPRALKPRADRPVPAPGMMTAQERIISASPLRLPRPDRAVTALDRSLMPADFAALDEDIPAVKADYAMNGTEKIVMQRIVSTRAMGMKMGRVNETRAFGIYGPPGTGKNELARQLAASIVTVDAAGDERQGVHMEQVEFDRDMDTGALIGTTALENGSTVARLGPIGLAAVQGSVICLNEVVRNPKALTQFQSMLEEGEIRLKTPEAGIVKIPIHPATTFVLTWNPGLEGDSDRPAEAPRSRIVSFELPAPTPVEQAKRVESFFSSAPTDIQPTKAEIDQAIAFTNQIRSAIHQGKIQQRGRGGKAVPGPRDLNQFVLAGKTDGWSSALEQMRVFCDQNVEDRERDWKVIQETFAVNFGTRASTGRR